MLFFNSSSILHQKVHDRNRDTPALWLMDLGKTLGIFSEFFTIVGLEVASKSPVLSVGRGLLVNHAKRFGLASVTVCRCQSILSCKDQKNVENSIQFNPY